MVTRSSSSAGVSLFTYLKRIGQIDFVIAVLYVVMLSTIGILMLVESGRTDLVKGMLDGALDGREQLVDVERLRQEGADAGVHGHGYVGVAVRADDDHRDAAEVRQARSSLALVGLDQAGQHRPGTRLVESQPGRPLRRGRAGPVEFQDEVARIDGTAGEVSNFLV